MATDADVTVGQDAAAAGTAPLPSSPEIPQSTSRLPTVALDRLVELLSELEAAIIKARASAWWGRFWHFTLFWLSVLFGMAASFWGIIGPSFTANVSAAQVSGLAAIATALQVALRQAGFYSKANWADRKADKLAQFVRLIRYSFRYESAQDQIDTIVAACNELDDQMTEELLQFVQEAITPPKPTRANGDRTPDRRQKRSINRGGRVRTQTAATAPG